MSTVGGKESVETDWRAVLAAVCLGVVAALHIGKVPPSLPIIMAELDIGLVAGGFVVSMFNLLGMLLGLPIGSFADRMGRRRAAIIGYLFLVIGGVTGALAGGLTAVLVSRAFEGLGFIAVAVTMPGIVSGVASSRDRPLALGIWSIFTPLGFAIALLVTPLILPFAGWRVIWAGLAAFCVAVLLLLLPRLPPVQPAAPGGHRQRLLEVLGRPRLWLLSAAFGSYAFQWVTLMAWLPSYLSSELGLSLVGASTATALVVAMNVPGNMLGGLLLRSGTLPGRLFLLGSLVMALSASGLFLGAEYGGFAGISLCVLFSFFGGLIPSVLFAQIPNVSPSPAHASQANGMLMQGSAAGQFIGPPLIGAAVAAAQGVWTSAIGPLAVAAFLTASAGMMAVRQPPAGDRPS